MRQYNHYTVKQLQNEMALLEKVKTNTKAERAETGESAQIRNIIHNIDRQIKAIKNY